MTGEADDVTHHVAQADEVPEDGGLIVDVEGESIAIFALDDGYYGLLNSCPHQGGPLGNGKVEGDCVYCPWHGHQFDIRTGEHGHLDHLDTRAYHVEERDGELFVHL